MIAAVHFLPLTHLPKRLTVFTRKHMKNVCAMIAVHLIFYSFVTHLIIRYTMFYLKQYLNVCHGNRPFLQLCTLFGETAYFT